MNRKRTERKQPRVYLRSALIAGGSVFLAMLLILTMDSTTGQDIRNAWKKISRNLFEPEIPQDYIPIYQEAADAYDIPWTLLAAHHRVETKFSTMNPLLSSAGAEGHMQFMPCTFVGWSHPTCGGLGKGNITEHDKTNPIVIKKYGGYGVDGDGDGVADPYNLKDALYSAANYLSESGASKGELESAIFHYNQSDDYVESVLFYYEKYEEQYMKDSK